MPSPLELYESAAAYTPVAVADRAGPLALLCVVAGLIGLVTCFTLPGQIGSFKEIPVYCGLAGLTSLAVGFGELFLASYVGVYT